MRNIASALLAIGAIVLIAGPAWAERPAPAALAAQRSVVVSSWRVLMPWSRPSSPLASRRDPVTVSVAPVSPAAVAQRLAPALQGESLSLVSGPKRGATTTQHYTTDGGVAKHLSTTTRWKTGTTRHAQGGQVLWVRDKTSPGGLAGLEVQALEIRTQQRDGRGRFTKAQGDLFFDSKAPPKYEQARLRLGLVKLDK